LVDLLLGKIKDHALLLNNQELKKSIYTCLAELVENANKHQRVLDGNKQNCIVVINEHNDVFQISVGNVLTASNRKDLMMEFEQNNLMGQEKMVLEIVNRLKSVNPLTNKSAKLGLLKIAVKTKGRVFYSLQELDNGDEFVLIRALIN
jgi:hypothetical protein